MGWSYSDMSHEAKLNGGPENWIESIRLNAETNGEKKMVPVIITTSIASLIVGSLFTNFYHWLTKEKVSDIDAEKAKEKLINKVNDNNVEPVELEEMLESA